MCYSNLYNTYTIHANATSAVVVDKEPRHDDQRGLQHGIRRGLLSDDLCHAFSEMGHTASYSRSSMRNYDLYNQTRVLLT